MQMEFFKPIERSLAAVNERSASGNRLLVYCKKHDLRFLIDTGASVSAIPVSPSLKSSVPISQLYAANNTTIPVHGRKILELNIGLRRPLIWDFFIADIDRPILGIDFLSSHQLVVDPANQQLIDDETKLKIKCLAENSDSSSLSAIPPLNDDYSSLLQKYPRLTSASEILFLPPVISEVRHHLITDCPPIACHPRRLSPTWLQIAKKEFQLLLQLGIARPSSSPWASPLHMVPKPDGSYRVVGDYRSLNKHTLPDSYPIPHIHDFSLSLENCTIFSQIDLIRAYNQILVSPEDVPKTAVATPFGLFEFVRMPMGLQNSAQTFDSVFAEFEEGSKSHPSNVIWTHAAIDFLRCDDVFITIGGLY
jgi:cleavage and polyadenylation specificity factor subunit 1